MRTNDTSIGRGANGFPRTTWGFLSQIGHAGDPERRSGLETLCRRYWRPVYLYVRHVWAKSNDDAKDLTQAFFLWILEDGALAKYDRDRGSFRRFLKVVLQGFVGHREEARKRLKRGGAVMILTLDDEGSALRDFLPDPRNADPEALFDSAWADEILQTAVERVRARLHADGRELHFRVYEKYEMLPTDRRSTYRELAAEVGVKETDIANLLYAVREMVRGEIRAQIADTTTDDRELDAEWKALFRA